MKNRKRKEWRILQRWSRLQRRAQNETDRGKLAKILGKMGSLIIQMEKRTIPKNNDAQQALIFGSADNEDRARRRAPFRTRVLLN
jgi:hypothetical protein